MDVEEELLDERVLAETTPERSRSWTKCPALKVCFRWTCQSYRETLPMYIHEKYQFQGNSQNSDKTDMKFVQKNRQALLSYP